MMTKKKLNAVFEKNQQNPYILYQSGELVKGICQKLVEHDKAHPKFKKTNPFLKQKELDTAKKTMLRGQEAARTMKSHTADAPEMNGIEEQYRAARSS